MPYEVRYSDEAVEQLRDLRAYDRAAIFEQVEEVLTVNPTLESKARVKKLRQPAPTEFRLRVGDYRVFYDVAEGVVLIVQVLGKADAIAYLEEGESS